MITTCFAGDNPHLEPERQQKSTHSSTSARISRSAHTVSVAASSTQAAGAQTYTPRPSLAPSTVSPGNNASFARSSPAPAFTNDRTFVHLPRARRPDPRASPQSNILVSNFDDGTHTRCTCTGHKYSVLASGRGPTRP
ncbi:hypothetical protein LTR28_002610 [Elasticomyces elasticus]|nr:hypothetical protein LTR28_002610 [Elasticomyces elasticus]